jgi:DNA (cytosine-5)-methyltransferase 1
LWPSIPARAREDGSGQPVIKVNQLNPSTESGGKQPYQQNRVYDVNGLSTTLCKDKADILIISSNTSKGFDEAEEEEYSINFSVPSSKTRRGRVGKKVSQTLDTQCNQGVFTKQRIRRLTPTECFRLMDFNQEMIEKTINSKLISDSQLYKQAGNSICVGVLAEIIKKINQKKKN